MEVSSELHAPASIPQGKQPTFLIGQEAGFVPEPVSTLWRRDISVASAEKFTRVFQLAVLRHTD
jgi:hypothetical protein